MSTLIEVIDNARALLNEPLDSTRSFPDNTSSFYTDAILTQYYNMIQVEIQGRLIQTFEDYFVTSTTFSIVNGTREYSLPGDFIKVVRMEDIRNTDSPLAIEPITLNEKDTGGTAYVSRPATTSRFGGYYIVGNQLAFGEVPKTTDASAVKMYYIQRVAEITAGSATSALPLETGRVTAWGIVKLAQHQQQSDNQFSALEFEKQLKRATAEAENRQVQKPRGVKRTKRSGGGRFYGST